MLGALSGDVWARGTPTSPLCIPVGLWDEDPARPPNPMLEASPVPAYRRVEAQVADVAGDELLLLERGGHAEGVADHRLLHRVHLEGEGGTGWLGGTGTRIPRCSVFAPGFQERAWGLTELSVTSPYVHYFI